MSDLAPRFISVDWGTSSFRAYLAGEDGRELESVETAQGALGLAPGAHEATLRSAIGAWKTAFPRLKIVVSGMAGARQGWKEAPYVTCPANAEALAKAALTVETALGPVSLIPGVCENPEGGRPDVMRGEETQIFGAMRAMDLKDALLVLPGTHSKWARLKAKRIDSFATYMTGDVYAAVKGHTVLARSMGEGKGRREDAFRRGVEAAKALHRPGDLLNALFLTRSLGLFDKLNPDDAPHYLSGLLIGAEIEAARGEATEAVLVGSAALAALYEAAGDALGVRFVNAPENCATLGQLALLNWLN